MDTLEYVFASMLLLILVLLVGVGFIKNLNNKIENKKIEMTYQEPRGWSFVSFQALD